jgi:uncharacterized membrane protein YfcA
MLSAKTILFALLGVFAAVFIIAWIRELTARKKVQPPPWLQGIIGFVTNFFDTLGIGSFATTTTVFRLLRVVPDEKIPGTLNVGHTLPTVAQAFIFIPMIEVEMKTLVSMIVATVLGGWLGAGVVTRLPRRGIQIGMGAALLVASAFLVGKLLYGDPEHPGTLGLDGGLLVAACVGTFVFGALMMIGVGAYAPIMIMVSLLGMNPKLAFPIMMGSCAFLMTAASIRFIRAGKYDAKAALGLTLGGIPAALIAGLVVVSMSLTVVGWLVVIVVLYTAISMLWAAWSSRRESAINGVKGSDMPA